MKIRNTIIKDDRLDGTGCGGSSGLTITEVCCALAALALLLTVALPALAMSKGRSQRIVCVNNLSRIGIAYAMWGNEHDNLRPMMVPYWEGGIQVGGIIPAPPPGAAPDILISIHANQAWFHYYWLSNELVTPKVLLCPSDSVPHKRAAGDWSASSATGLYHPNFRNNAVSYIVAHSYSESDRGLVSGDRNFPFTTALGNCGYGLQAINVTTPGGGVSGWRPISSAGLHGLEGNLLFKDGSVEQVDSIGLASLFSPTNWSLGRIHYMAP